MTSPDYARGPAAQRQRHHKARVLARWCYARGIGPAVVQQPPEVLRAAARQADVNPPHPEPDDSSPTWLLVGQLLHARAAWDRRHGQLPPEHVPCIACAVLQQPCPQCARPEPSSCAGCGGRLDQFLVDERLNVHPSCQDPAAAASPAPARHHQAVLLEVDQRTG